jgi:hypothetical protein
LLKQAGAKARFDCEGCGGGAVVRFVTGVDGGIIASLVPRGAVVAQLEHAGN